MLLRLKKRYTKDCIFFNIPLLNLSFFHIMGLIRPYRMTANCQKSLRIKFDEKMILTSVPQKATGAIVVTALSPGSIKVPPLGGVLSWGKCSWHMDPHHHFIGNTSNWSIYLGLLGFLLWFSFKALFLLFLFHNILCKIYLHFSTWQHRRN